jgi:hypothetical protein
MSRTMPEVVGYHSSLAWEDDFPARRVPSGIPYNDRGFNGFQLHRRPFIAHVTQCGLALWTLYGC